MQKEWTLSHAPLLRCHALDAPHSLIRQSLAKSFPLHYHLTQTRYLSLTAGNELESCDRGWHRNFAANTVISVSLWTGSSEFGSHWMS